MMLRGLSSHEDLSGDSHPSHAVRKQEEWCHSLAQQLTAGSKGIITTINKVFYA